jgi:hypothetical protein
MFGYAYAELVAAQNTSYYYTPQQQYVPPIYQSRGAPCDHRSSIIFYQPMQEGRHSNAQPNEPHLPRTGRLSPGAMEKIKEEMAELLRERLDVSVARSGQSYQKPYNHRFDIAPYS